MSTLQEYRPLRNEAYAVPNKYTPPTCQSIVS